MVRARRCIRSISLTCLMLLGMQLVSELSAAYGADSGNRSPSFETADESHRSSCLPSAGRGETLAMNARSSGPTAPDGRIRLDDHRTAGKRPIHPIVLRSLHRPPHSLLRQRVRLSPTDDVPG